MQLLDLADYYKEYPDVLSELDRLLKQINEEFKAMCKGG